MVRWDLEQTGMEQKVEISRGLLGALVGSLAVTLLVLAFLLGRMSSPSPPVAAVSPSPPLVASSVQAPVVLETSTPALLAGPSANARLSSSSSPSPRVAPTPKMTEAAPPPVAVAPPPRTQPPPPPPQPPVARPPAHHLTRPRPKPVETARPASPAAGISIPAPPPAATVDVQGIRKYFSQLDSAMTGSAAISDPNAFATELLQQSLQGDTSGFDALLGSAEESLRTVQSIKPPPSCAEHHKLTVGQLRDGVDLLRKVKGATASMDTSSLSALSLEGKGMQADLARLQELDRQLRAQSR